MAVTLTEYELAKALGMDLEDVAPDARERKESEGGDGLAHPGLPTRRASYTYEETRAKYLRDVVADAVVRFAPDAPDTTHNEAALRMAGWLWERKSGFGEVNAADGVRVVPQPGAPSALRASGASALLAPYRTHRAGKCEA